MILNDKILIRSISNSMIHAGIDQKAETKNHRLIHVENYINVGELGKR